MPQLDGTDRIFHHSSIPVAEAVEVFPLGVPHQLWRREGGETVLQVSTYASRSEAFRALKYCVPADCLIGAKKRLEIAIEPRSVVHSSIILTSVEPTLDLDDPAKPVNPNQVISANALLFAIS